MKVALIIPAAGVGARFSTDVKKQFYEVDGKPILYYTLKIILNCYRFDELIIGANLDDFPLLEYICKSLDINIPYRFIEGGKRRVDTVFNCIQSSNADIVAVHDAVRPFINKAIVHDVVNKAIEIGGAICALKVRDTVKEVVADKVHSTISRDKLYLAHTPQVFDREKLNIALSKATADRIDITDEASAFEYSKFDVGIVSSSYDNIKVTFIEDIDNITILLKKYKGV